MSKWMLIAAMAALVIVPSLSGVCGAEEAPQAKQSACGKSTHCAGKSCKCVKCENGACDKENCDCAECETAGCECTLAAGSACDEADCRGAGVSLVACSKKDCASGDCSQGDCNKGDCASKDCCRGECASKKCCQEDCTAGSCGKGKCSKSVTVAAESDCGEPGSQCQSNAVLTLGGPSWFTIATPSATSGLSNEVWQQISHEYRGSEIPVLRRVAFLTGPIAEAECGIAEAPEVAASGQSAEGESCDEQIEYRIQIVEDHEGCLGEYDDLRRGKPVMFAETKTLLPTMRVLEKHHLVRRLSSPTLISASGQTAQIEINGDGDRQRGLRIEVASERAEGGLNVRLAMHAQEDDQRFEVKTALVVEPGHTIVLNASPLPRCQGSANNDEQCPVYVVLTPVIVK